jgi:phosphoribosyl 1,2-cyclic phosphate phosphodiesterase
VEVIFLGTGTSQGVPVVGCSCSVCKSDNPRDIRTRPSVYLVKNDYRLLIDTTPDLRQQFLQNNLDNIDSILITHEHNDHIMGLDDVRPINFLHNKEIPLYGIHRVIKDIRFRFDYIFKKSDYPGSPRLTLNEIQNYQPFIPEGANFKVLPFEIIHGQLPISGFKIDDFVYITDASEIPNASFDIIKNCEVLVINCLQHTKHYSHFNFEQAMAQIEKISPNKTYLTHISHKLGTCSAIESVLPMGISVACDGLNIQV